MTTVKKEPLLRIMKKKELPRNQAVLLRVGSFVLALVAGAIFLLILGVNPLQAYASIFKGAFVGSVRNPYSSIQATVKLAIPLMICALGLSYAFKLKFWNIGAEGQLIMGGIFASYFALFHADWPHWLLMLVMLLAGIVGGALWALLPTLFKVRFNTNETLFTLMLNYIALYTIDFLKDGPWKDPDQPGFAAIAFFDQNAWADKVLGIQFGWIVALLLMALTFVYLNHTKQGYEIAVVGGSPTTAHYAGINVKKVIIRTMIISGAFCGLAGMLQVSGNDYTLSGGVAGGTGFLAITVAWLAQLNPFMIAVFSLFFSILEKGSMLLQTQMNISKDASDVLQGIILFFFLGCEFFIQYSIRFRHSKKEVKA